MGDSNDDLLLGIDIGTSACKVAVFDRRGNAIAQASESYPLYYPQAGWVEQDADEWWLAICTALRQIISEGGVDPAKIRGIGVDGQSWSAIPVDQSGNCLAKTPIWMDTRAREIAAQTVKALGVERIFSVAGNGFEPAYTTPKMLWFKAYQPDIFQRTYKFLQSNSYIVLKLTGMMSQDMSQGYGLHFFDMKKRCYDEELADQLGLTIDLVPSLYECHQVVGYVTKEAASLTGLKAGIPVVAGGLDAACGTLGAGVCKAGQTQEQGGQAGGMSICMDEAVAHPKLILSPHVIPGQWLLQGGSVGGGGVLRWFKEELGAEESFDQLTKRAEVVSCGADGVIFLPYMAGERSPVWDPDAKGVFFGLGYDKTKGHLVRAALEGVAYSLEHNLAAAREAGVEVEEMLAMGGAANSYLWTQIKSDVTGKVIKVPASDTATTLGAAMLAGVGTGMYDSFEEAVSLTVEVKRIHYPNQEHRAIYQKMQKAYVELYQRLKGLII